MKSHIEVIESVLKARGYQTYFVDVPKDPTYPYVVLWSDAGLPSADSLAGCEDILRGRIGVTSVAVEPLPVLAMQAEVRRLLAPSARRWKRLNVPGRAAFLRLFDTRTVDVDRQVTLTSANRHPSFGVDIFELDSQPK